MFERRQPRHNGDFVDPMLLESQSHRERRTCAGKMQYAHPKARSVAAQMRRMYDSPLIMEYRCPFCRRWHVGKPGERFRS